MKTKKPCKKNSIKVYSRITLESYRRLSYIRDKCGFKSNYEIIQYLVHCFLRVADKEHDQQIECIPDEVEQMFNDLSESEKHFEYVKPKRRAPYHKI